LLANILTIVILFTNIYCSRFSNDVYVEKGYGVR
jgi:hypothetical protein